MKQFVALEINEAASIKGGSKLSGDTLFCEWYVSNTSNTHNAAKLTGADAAHLEKNS